MPRPGRGRTCAPPVGFRRNPRRMALAQRRSRRARHRRDVRLIQQPLQRGDLPAQQTDSAAHPLPRPAAAAGRRHGADRDRTSWRSSAATAARARRRTQQGRVRRAGHARRKKLPGGCAVVGGDGQPTAAGARASPPGPARQTRPTRHTSLLWSPAASNEKLWPRMARTAVVVLAMRRDDGERAVLPALPVAWVGSADASRPTDPGPASSTPVRFAAAPHAVCTNAPAAAPDSRRAPRVRSVPNGDRRGPLLERAAPEGTTPA